MKYNPALSGHPHADPITFNIIVADITIHLKILSPAQRLPQIYSCFITGTKNHTLYSDTQHTMLIDNVSWTTSESWNGKAHCLIQDHNVL